MESAKGKTPHDTENDVTIRDFLKENNLDKLITFITNNKIPNQVT